MEAMNFFPFQVIICGLMVVERLKERRQEGLKVRGRRKGREDFDFCFCWWRLPGGGCAGPSRFNCPFIGEYFSHYTAIESNILNSKF
jgi:hypothetical protein